MVWLPELMQHENGAKALAGVIAVAADPRAASSPWARVFGEAAFIPEVGGLPVEMGTAPLRILSRGSFEREFPHPVTGTMDVFQE